VNRDLVFFVAGLCFGAAAGFFLFRTVIARDATTVAATARPTPASSQIGLDTEPEPVSIDTAAVERLEAEAKSDPDDAQVRGRLGRMYLDAARYEDAAAWLQSALEIDRSNLDTRTELALSYLNLGRLDDAVAMYEEALRLEPEHPASLLGLGRVKLYLLQDINGGLAMWETLVAVAPGSAEAQSVRDELEALKSAHPGG
jgi:tetratricopeptide (TPR) repeat protein